MLKSIKENAEKDIQLFKAAKEKEYQEEYAKVYISTYHHLIAQEED